MCVKGEPVQPRSAPLYSSAASDVYKGRAPGEADSGKIRFPDSVTERGQKHLRTLMTAARAGHRAVLFFCVQHGGARSAGPADDVDPVYERLLREAAGAGVEILGWRPRMSTEDFVLDAPGAGGLP